MTIVDLEKAVAELAPDQFEQFLAWIEEYNAARLDQKIERDAASGKLDRFADRVIAGYKAGRARVL